MNKSPKFRFASSSSRAMPTLYCSALSDPKLQADRRRNMINVRSERILEDKKSYWYRLRKQGCLIPVSGTFEHRAI
ncbi:MAG: SOS response-associated peptidase [Sphingobacterium sp.]|nr:SOS response-associated peptidase [Sphingobacterium sp.]